MKQLKGRTAVLTGAASGLGLELARLAGRTGMRIVMADVQAGALDRAAEEIRSLGVEVLPFQLDVARAAEVEALGQVVQKRFGSPHLLFNNAGVSAGGLIWEHSVQDWDWILGVNLMGVAHGVRVFTPMMLAAARADPSYEGHIVNTASMAGLVNMPNMGAYNVSKHAVVSLSETLYQDLMLVTDRVGASVLCPFFVPTGIHESARNRPSDLSESKVSTTSQQVAQAAMSKAVVSGKVTAQEIARRVLDAVLSRQFYIYSHSDALGGVKSRMEDLLSQSNPSNPFAGRPDIGTRLREALNGVRTS